MTALINYQIINNRFGKPEYVLVPYDKYLQLTSPSKINLDDGVPSELVDLLFDKQYSPARAWREYLQLTQEECAKKLGITQPAYSQLESSKRPRKATRIKLATALGIHECQLDLLA
ncbi:helix-turn-helix domain-containing protein [Snodgrassella communis]|uniref:helix-turn-helix domain-containing protein n=1 Tax=Snodgrassella communis TaxID=2946699 RepID=UPI001EF5DC3A|nr:helix-turn-helix transcriptional regulator [Snodgrassella communis]WMY91894.1 helix-turn-helix transcriptional regulator [Snodgrassella communis]